MIPGTHDNPQAFYRTDCGVCVANGSDPLGFLTPLPAPSQCTEQGLKQIREAYLQAYKQYQGALEQAKRNKTKTEQDTSLVSNEIVLQERRAYVYYLRVAMCLVRPALVYLRKHRNTPPKPIHEVYKQFCKDFQDDALNHRAAGSRGDLTMRIKCPVHNNPNGHAFPLQNHYNEECWVCCTAATSLPIEPSSRDFERVSREDEETMRAIQRKTRL